MVCRWIQTVRSDSCWACAGLYRGSATHSGTPNQDEIVSAVPNPSSHAPAGPWSIDLSEAGPSTGLLDSPATISFVFHRDAVTLVRFGLAMVVAGMTAVWVAAVQHSREIRVAFPLPQELRCESH